MGRRARGRKAKPGPGRKFWALSVGLAAISGLLTGMRAGVLLMPAPAPAQAAAAPAGEPIASAAASPTTEGLFPRLQTPLNVLVMATDVDWTYEGGKRVMGLRGRTDTMMLARLDPARNEVRMLSIPRDTRVALAGHGHVKINAANPYGGPQLAAQAVADLLGVTVDRYLVINTVAVKQLVDALGGVTLYVQKPMHYDDYSGGLHIHLKAGWNRLDGQQAHDYLRFRHDDGGDIGRIQRQQRFLEAVMTQYMTPANLLRTPQLLGIAQRNLTTDLSSQELMAIAGWGKDLKQDQVQMTMVPGRDAMIGGSWYWETDPDANRRLAESFLAGETPAVSEQVARRYTVTLRDGVGDRRALAALRQSLAKAGYGDLSVDARMPDLNLGVTEIIAQNADLEGARALAESLGVGRVVVAATGSRQTDFTIIMGRDWVARGSSQANAPR